MLLVKRTSKVKQKLLKFNFVNSHQSETHTGTIFALLTIIFFNFAFERKKILSVNFRMIGKIKILLSKVASPVKLEKLINSSGQHLFLPFYHLVSDNDLPHIKHLYTIVSVERFKKDLDFFEKHYSPIAANELTERISSGKPIVENRFFLSFDDGLREFYDTVAPILLQRGIPATFFVNTDFIDNKDMFFRLKASVLIDKITKRGLSEAESATVNSLFASVNLSYNHVSDLLKITFQKRHILDKIADVADVDFQDYLTKQKPYLTSEQIRKLIAQGFTIGAHSVSHPYYADLSEKEQTEQTLDSLNFIKENFQPEQRLFSFPFTDFGVDKSFFDKIKQETDLTFGTASLKLDSIKNNLQRTPMENSGYSSTEAFIKSEYLMFMLKKTIGKHIMHR